MKKNYQLALCITFAFSLFCGCAVHPVVEWEVEEISTITTSMEPNEPHLAVEQPEAGELSVVQVYNLVKEYDYWHYAYDGSVKAFKGEEEITLQGEERACDIQLYEGWLYYAKIDKNTTGYFHIIRIKPEGEDPTVMVSASELDDTSGGSFLGMTFCDGYMYFQRGFTLYQYDLDTGKYKVLCNDIEIYHIIDNLLYFKRHVSNDSTFYIMDLDTGKTSILLGDGLHYSNKECPRLLYRNFLFVGNVMYYTRRTVYSESEPYFAELFRYKNGESILVDCGTQRISEYTIFEYDGKLCYVVWEDGERKLMQYDPEDCSVTEIVACDGFYDEGQIASGYFYYLDNNHKLHRVKI